MPPQTSSEADRLALAQFLIQSHPKSEHKKFIAGEILFQENTAARGCHVIQAGNVELSVLRFDGNRAVVECLGAGSLIGVSAAFAKHKYLFTARALNDTATIYIPRQQVVQLFQRHPDMRMLVLRSLSQSVQAMRCFVASRRAAG